VASEHHAAFGKNGRMSDKIVETKETTVEKQVVHEEPAVVEKRTVVEERPRPETITIETHTEG
jgi:hypothetical protein